MTDQGAAAAAAPTAIPAVRVVQETPVVFADSIASHSVGFGVAKMYFTRFDPDPQAIAGPTERVVLQMVMPVESFVMSVAFLEHRLKMMVDTNAIPQKTVDDAREYWRKNPTGGMAGS